LTLDWHVLPFKHLYVVLLRFEQKVFISEEK